jgi:hypothetical protein
MVVSYDRMIFVNLEEQLLVVAEVQPTLQRVQKLVAVGA